MTAASFRYRAVDRAGVRRSGAVPAASQSEAFRKVAALGLTPLDIRPVSTRITRAAGRRLPAKELSHFTYQLGVFVSARIPVSDGLMSVAEQERPGPLRELAMDLARRISAGESIAAAMDAHRPMLGEVYVETVRAAERAGNLSKVLEHLSEMLERLQETRQQVRGAMMYPACVLFVLLMAVVFLVGFVVPKFAAMFEQRNLQLPFFTRALMLLGQSMQSYWWAYLLGLAAAAIALRFTWRRPAGRAAIDRLLHRIPYLRDILVGLTLSRFSRIFSLGLSSGLGVLESLELGGKAAARPMLMADIDRMVAQVRVGGGLSQTLSSCGYFTPFAKRMLAAGEQSGELPRMCTVVARHYERETTHLTKNLSTVIEPVLIVLIAGLVLCIALAIFIPMWDMGRLVS